ncbi:phosphonate metabolism protein PhnP [Marinobacter guineae]|uniref:Phosphonate metabolism protein PhnP n=1 Tax=Marinobacter guineae TaxID=432303 RepID=A0A2G1VG64_9GAMM|nr:phosphonate metabolism protein PhnP [Marinobacter guineae]PHQ25755.1 phosphonate metabolism protein PhnP [Marinobacter guineae]
MRITFLGTGAAGGVPLFGCECAACANAKKYSVFSREPCSALIESGANRILIDGGLMDLHKRFAPGELDAILLTHFHPDHVQGLFHLRWGKGPSIPVLIPPDPDGCADLFRHPGMLDFSPQEAFTAFEIGPLKVTPVPLIHSKPTFGYVFEPAGGPAFAYLTDTRGLPRETRDFLQTMKPEGLAIDCSFPPSNQPKGHNDWALALDCIKAVGPARAWLIHISHDLDNWRLSTNPELPAHIRVAQDGDRVDLTPGTVKPGHE